MIAKIIEWLRHIEPTEGESMMKDPFHELVPENVDLSAKDLMWDQPLETGSSRCVRRMLSAASETLPLYLPHTR